MDYNYIELEDYRSPKYEDRGHGDDPCFLCGKRVNVDKAKYVHLLCDGRLVDSKDDFESNNDQGFFPVGPECSKKIPTNFLF
jgi:hypothetical protein